MAPAPLPFERIASGTHAGAGVLRLEQAGKPVIVLDHDLIRRLDASLDSLPSGLTGLVLASASERVFVAGADLKTIVEWDDAQLDKYLAYGQKVFGRLSQLPFPTAAAINGAALGGGLELAMHCDLLVAAPSASGKPYPVGLPEAGLCICPGWGGTNLFPARIEPKNAIARAATGQTMTFDQARDAGMFDAVAAEPTRLIETAFEALASVRSKGRIERDGAPSRWIGRPRFASSTLAALDAVRPTLPETESAEGVCRAVDAGLSRGWQAALDAERATLVRLRRTPAGAAAIRAFFERSEKKN